MSLIGFIRPEEVSAGLVPLQNGTPAGFSELFSLGRKAFNQNYNTNAKDRLYLDERESNQKLAEQILGREIKPQDASSFEEYQSTSSGASTIDLSARIRHDFKYIDQAIEELKAKDPEKYGKVKTREQVEKAIRERARMSEQEFALASKRKSSFIAGLGGFAGQLVAGFSDPINVGATLLTGGLGAGRAGATAIMKTALREAGINATIEGVSQPIIANWQKEIGNEYGFKDAAVNVGFAALFGGGLSLGARGVSAGVRGAKPAASWVFEKIGAMESLPVKVRSSAKYMSRIARIEETNPHVRDVNLSNKRAHMESVSEAVQALSRGERVDGAKLKISEQEFNDLATAHKRGDSATVKARLDELKRFQEEGKIRSGVKARAADASKPSSPSYTIQSLPQQVLEKARKKGVIRKSDFAPEELAMLDSAGFKFNAQGQLKKQPLVNELKARAKDGTLFDINGKKTSHIDDYNARIREESNDITRQDLDAQEKNLADAIDETQKILDERAVEYSVANELARRADSPDTIAAEQAAFDAMLNENPNLKISLEDRDITLKELVDEFKNDERLLREIKGCALK